MNKYLNAFLWLLATILILNGAVYFIKIIFGTYILSLLNSALVVYQINGSTKILEMIPMAFWGFVINLLLLFNGGLLYWILRKLQ